MKSCELHLGDCRNVLPTLEANSVDAVVTDPPYGLSFMGEDWDQGVPGKQFWTEALRVAKPGAHLLAFGGTRTFHRLAVAIEDAGWVLRDCIQWVYSSGFPKSQNVSKAIDKSAGAEREVVGLDQYANRGAGINGATFKMPGSVAEKRGIITASATDSAKQWDGWGTCLKPAWEPIIVARKPLEGNMVENVQKHGTGPMNIDACRVELDDDAKALLGKAKQRTNKTCVFNGNGDRVVLAEEIDTFKANGRWPANVIHDGSEEVLDLFTGNSARFFYCSKANKKDKGEGNTHPTTKPNDLMRYLCRLVTPSGGIVLDPFMGSGSTGKAAIQEGFGFIGIERIPEYFTIAENRL